MMPVYRIRDGYSKLSENEAIFKTCEELFKEKKSILMFAEGNHGEHHYLRPLTKGAARLALNSQLKMESELKVLPVGLNYFDHQASNSKVIIVFGEPISVSDFVETYQKSNGVGLNDLKDEIASGMKSTLVIPDKTEDYGALKNTIFQRSNEGLTFQELKEVEANDQMISSTKSRHLFAKVLNPIPFLVIWSVLSGVKDIVFHSSLKFAVGLVTFPVWWLVTFLVIHRFFGIIPATVVVLLMIVSLPISYRWSK